jgi:hypothetical protein
MSIERQILEELKRFNQITGYINEQEVAPPAPDDGGAPPAPDAGATPPAPDAGATPPAPDAGAPAADAGGADAIPEPVDVESDPDVEEVDTKKDEEEGTEEIDITDLVTTQEEIKTKQEEFMDSMFSKLNDLETKLNQMDQIMSKIDSIESKVEKSRPKSPEEKLMLRSLDSYPYNQKLTDYFEDKKEDFEKQGKEEYILTSDEVENYSPNEVKKTKVHLYFS